MPSFQIHHLITSLQGGGTENFLWQLLARSPKDVTHQVLYLKEDGVIGDRIRALDIPVQKCAGPLPLWSHLTRTSPNVLHTLLFRAHQVGRIAGWLARVPKIISSQRAIDAWAKPWQESLDQWTLRKCNLVLCNSKSAESLVLKRRGASKIPEVRLLPNAVEMAPPSDAERLAARTSYGIPADAVVGVSLMRLHAEKGADLIPAFARTLLEARSNLHLIVGGVGPLERDLKKRTQAGICSQRLHWIGWEDHSRRLLSAADFCFSLSREESYPQFLLEAAVMGLPWVGPKVGGVPDVQSEGSAGHLFPVGRVSVAVEQTSALLSQLEELGVRARAAAPAIASAHTPQIMADSFYRWVREH